MFFYIYRHACVKCLRFLFYDRTASNNSHNSLKFFSAFDLLHFNTQLTSDDSKTSEAIEFYLLQDAGLIK